MKAFVILSTLAAALAALAAALLNQGVIRFNYPSFEEFPVQGIDVSHHQQEIDWQQVAGARAQFAYIKASEGATFRDPKFVANWNAALDVGVTPGAYHFFTLCKSGEEQAKNFLGALGSVGGGISALNSEAPKILPPAVDLEFGGNCGKRPSPEEFAAQLQAFLNELRRVVPCPPVFYVTQEFYYPYVAGRFQDRRLWVRDIYMKPSLKDQADWDFWQFANRGRLPGVTTFVDLNVFKGTAARFDELRCGSGEVVAKQGAW